MKSLPPVPSDLRRITLRVSVEGERCSIRGCRATAKWTAWTVYAGGKRHTTGLCEQHARTFAVNLGGLL